MPESVDTKFSLMYFKYLIRKELSMPKNGVQFQKGQSLPEFLKLYGTVPKCEQAVFAAHRPKGFRCPNCGYHMSCQLRQRKVFQCIRCKHQASLTAGTLFDNTKLPLTTWPFACSASPRTASRRWISSANWGELQRSLDDQAQTYAGDARAGCRAQDALCGGCTGETDHRSGFG